MPELFDDVRVRLDKLIAEWKSARGDSVLTAKEVGMLMIHAGQELAWLMGFRSDTAALRNAAERLFDEVLMPMADTLVAGGLMRLPWWMKPLQYLLPPIVNNYKAKVRAMYVDMIEGAFEAFNNVLVDERQDATEVALAQPSAVANDPQKIGRANRRERRMSAAAVRKGRAL